MPSREIPYDEWGDFCETFSLDHRGWLVSIEVIGAEGPPLVLSRDMPLQRIAAERREGGDTIRVVAGAPAEEQIAHPISHPTLLGLQQDDRGQPEGLKIVSADGTTTTLRLRSPARPERGTGLPLR